MATTRLWATRQRLRWWWRPIASRRRLLEFAIDVGTVVVAYAGAYLLRYERGVPDDQWGLLVRSLPAVAAIELAALLAGGVYRELWRYARVEDLVKIAWAVLGGAGMAALAVVWLAGDVVPSRTVLVLNLLLLLILATASRLAARLLAAAVRSPRAARPDSRPVLIYGAGHRSALLARQVLDDPRHSYAPVGFVDADASKRGRRVNGLRIFGRDDVDEVVRAHGVSEVLVSVADDQDGLLADLRARGLCLRRMSLRFD